MEITKSFSELLELGCFHLLSSTGRRIGLSPNRLPHEAGLKLLTVPRAPKELPVSALIRNAQGIAEWKLFLNDKTEP